MTYIQKRKRLTNLENERMVSRREGLEEEIVREFGMDMYTLLYLKWITNKALLYSTWHPGWEGNLGENEYVCVWLNPFTVHQKLSQHC